MIVHRLSSLVLSVAFVVTSACSRHDVSLETQTNCEMGIYSHGEQSVVLYPRIRAGMPLQVGYTFVDGRRGILDDPGSDLFCKRGSPQASDGADFDRVALTEQDTTFENDELVLAGRLITPAVTGRSIRPLAVFVHGSESTPTVGHSAYPYLLAAQGVTVFAYDKRGTGQSTGEYTQNFSTLAGDAAAAFNHATQMAEGQFDRAGYYGGSQGGWVAPLAAMVTNADFLVVGFGLVLAPVEEDAEQVYDEMRRAGYEASDIDNAREVTAATGKIVASHFSEGIEELMAVKLRHADAPWFQIIEGEFTGSILRASEADLHAGIAGDFEDSNVMWNHDPVAVLQSLEIPQLWVIAANDTVAPGDVTQMRLRALQAEGLPLVLAVFPETDHGMIEFIDNPDGTRTYTRFTEGYFRLIADTMKQTVSPPYGRADIERESIR